MNESGIILYGVPGSYYTGKARAYLIKQGIPHREIAPKTAHYVNDVLPVVHRRIIPTLELPNNQYIQDSTVIIEHFEKQPGTISMLPETPRQKIIALLLDVMGSEGLLRPAMHYRWNFDEDNKNFLTQGFSSSAPSGADDPLPHAEKGMNRMRQAADNFGVNPETYSVIETAYLELLDLMERHFAKMPYLLGGRPSIGDFGMIAPFYAHLSRDPHPSMIMKKRALRVFRWTERMNRPNQDAGEYSDCPETYLADDEIPETLKAVLKLIAEDFVPETRAAAACINEWIDRKKPEKGSQAKRGVGFGIFEFRGVKIRALAQPYRFFLMTRMQNAYKGLDKSGREDVKTLFDELGIAELLSVNINREVLRHDHLEVWG